MKNKKTLIIAGTSLLVLSVLYFAYKKKQFDQENDILNDVEFQDLLKKVDNAKK
jgi:cbb3-type cytochrome oxidase subunit 3